eukprot:jgi/Mesvir1/24182/Mv10899-RA.1
MWSREFLLTLVAALAVASSVPLALGGCPGIGSATVADLTDNLDPFAGAGGALWRLVRRIGSDPMPGSTNYFFPEQDNLGGLITFGGYPDINSAYSWTVPFGEWDQILFITGDSSAWMIMNKGELFNRVGGSGAYFTSYASSARCVKRSHWSANEYTVTMNFDSGRPEHPYIYHTDGDDTTCMYGELNKAYPLPIYATVPAGGQPWPVETVGDDATRSTQAREHGGINIFVRKAVATCTTNDDCADGIICNGDEVCNSGTCGAGTHTCGSDICDVTRDVCVAGNSYGPGVTSDLDPNDILTVTSSQTWTLVRRIGSKPMPGRSVDRFFPINDNLQGKVRYSYPDTVDPAASSNTWSIPFPADWNQILIRTGNGMGWFVMNKQELYNRAAGGDATNWVSYGPAYRCVLMSHLQSTPYQAQQYFRGERPEDPWLSYYSVLNEDTDMYGEYNPDHGAPVPGMGYYEPDYHQRLHAQHAALHDGVNVYVRRAPGPGGVVNACTTDDDCSDGIYCNGAETCVSSQCQSNAPPSCSASEVCDEVNTRCLAVANCDANAKGVGSAADITGPTAACTVDPLSSSYGGWLHVRRIGTQAPLDSPSYNHGSELYYFRTYFPDDELAGDATSAPNIANQRPREWTHATWSDQFPAGWNQILFMTGDGARWMIMNKGELFNDPSGLGSLVSYDGNSPRCMLRSHLRCASGYKVAQLFRSYRGEDPVLSYVDHSQQNYLSVLYHEYMPHLPFDGNPSDNAPIARQWGTQAFFHGGLNIYVRAACLDDIIGPDSACAATTSEPFCWDNDNNEADGDEGICVVCIDDQVGDFDTGCTTGICAGDADDGDGSAGGSCDPECTSNLDCPAAPPRDPNHRLCDVARGICVVCLDSADNATDLGCTDENKFCNDGGADGNGGGNNTCVECLVDGNCPAGQYCGPNFLCGTCVDDQVGDVDSGCATGICVGDADAGDGSVNSTCIPDCVDTSQGGPDAGCPVAGYQTCNDGGVDGDGGVGTQCLLDCSNFTVSALDVPLTCELPLAIVAAFDVYLASCSSTFLDVEAFRDAIASLLALNNCQVSLTVAPGNRRHRRQLLQVTAEQLALAIEARVGDQVTAAQVNALLQDPSFITFLATFLGQPLGQVDASLVSVVVSLLSSATSDPHFVTASGAKFDFAGVPGATYCLVTHPAVGINMRIVGENNATSSAGREGEATKRTWMDQLGITFGSDRVLVDAEDKPGTPFPLSLGTIMVNGAPASNTECRKSTWPATH